jgi:hypothetical protein
MKSAANLETKLLIRIMDPDVLDQLLLLEKARRNVSPNDLLFLAIRNIAHHWWCTQQAIFMSKAKEVEFFHAYLHDRIKAAAQLGHILPSPKNIEAFLEIGDDIKYEQIESLNPLTQEKATSLIEKQLEMQNDDIGTKIGNQYQNPSDDMERGIVHERLLAEHYPSFRWNFTWKQFVVVGIPDGITRSFVYEFKSARNRNLLWLSKPIADAQADLYGFFFKRSRKRIQIYVSGDRFPKTYENEVSSENAIATLGYFTDVALGAPARPPRARKCKNCEYADVCSIFKN